MMLSLAAGISVIALGLSITTLVIQVKDMRSS